MDKQYYILPYSISTVAEICTYLESLGLVPLEHFSVTYNSAKHNIEWWFIDPKYLTMVFLKFGGQE